MKKRVLCFLTVLFSLAGFTGCPFMPGPDKGILSLRLGVQSFDQIGASRAVATIEHQGRGYKTSRKIPLNPADGSAFESFQFVPEGTWIVNISLENANHEEIFALEKPVMLELRAGEQGTLNVTFRKEGDKTVSVSSWDLKTEAKVSAGITQTRVWNSWTRTDDDEIKNLCHIEALGEFQNILSVKSVWPDGLISEQIKSRTVGDQSICFSSTQDRVSFVRRDFSQDGIYRLEVRDINELGVSGEVSVGPVPFGEDAIPELRCDSFDCDDLTIGFDISSVEGILSCLVRYQFDDGTWDSRYMSNVNRHNPLSPIVLDKNHLSVDISVLVFDCILSQKDQGSLDKWLENKNHPEEIIQALVDNGVKVRTVAYDRLVENR